MNAQEFVAHYNDEGFADSAAARWLFTNASFREAIYRTLHPQPSPDQRQLLYDFLAYEITDREEENDEYFENLYWCAFLISRLGNPGDVELLWRAKMTDFDSSCYFDAECLVGAGVDTTIEHLNGRITPEAKDALAYILENQRVGTFNDIDRWVKFRTDYYTSLEHSDRRGEGNSQYT